MCFLSFSQLNNMSQRVACISTLRSMAVLSAKRPLGIFSPRLLSSCPNSRCACSTKRPCASPLKSARGARDKCQNTDRFRTGYPHIHIQHTTGSISKIVFQGMGYWKATFLYKGPSGRFRETTRARRGSIYGRGRLVSSRCIPSSNQLTWPWVKTQIPISFQGASQSTKIGSNMGGEFTYPNMESHWS